MSKVGIIIVNYKNWQTTVDCLNSLVKSDYSNFQTVVVENGSENGSFENLQKWAKDFGLGKFLVVDSGDNLGFAGGCNFGYNKLVEAGYFDYFWFLNPDTIVEKNSLSSLVEEFERLVKIEPKLGMLGCKQMMDCQPDKIHTIHKTLDSKKVGTYHVGEGEMDKGQYDQELLDVEFVNGSSMFVSKEFIDGVGLMEEDWFLNFEEIDWQKRGRNKGWKIAYTPKCKICHKVSETIGHGSFVDFYYMTRNRLYFAKRYYPNRVATIIFDRIIFVFKSLILLKFNQARAVSTGVFDYLRGKRGEF